MATIGYTILVETDTEMIKAGPFFKSDGLIDNADIRKNIRRSFIEHHATHISAEDVTDFLVIATDGNRVEAIEPDLQDVWPDEFGKETETSFFKKGGDK